MGSGSCVVFAVCCAADWKAEGSDWSEGGPLFYCRYCDLAATAARCFVFVHCSFFFFHHFFFSHKLVPLFECLSGFLLSSRCISPVLSFLFSRCRPTFNTRRCDHTTYVVGRPDADWLQLPDVSVSDLAVGISASPRVSDKVQGLWRIGGSWVGLVEPRLGGVPGSRRCLNVGSCFHVLRE